MLLAAGAGAVLLAGLPVRAQVVVTNYVGGTVVNSALVEEQARGPRKTAN
jgi:hypothetical protein